MHSIQELFFGRVGQNGTLCVPNVFTTFKKTKILHYFTSREREKKQSKPTQVLSGLLSLFLNYFCAKIKCISAALTVVSFAANVWSRLTKPSEELLHDVTK